MTKFNYIQVFLFSALLIHKLAQTFKDRIRRKNSFLPDIDMKRSERILIAIFVVVCMMETAYEMIWLEK